MKEWGYRPILTQIRFIAVLLVIAYHAGLNPSGYIGVDLFFVLSGFLISNLLIESKPTENPIKVLQTFYINRMKRLLPLATFVLASITVASVTLFRTVPENTIIPNVRSSALWFQNWNLIQTEGNYFQPSGVNPFSHFWSLSVEEQFYLFFPLALISIALLASRLGLSLVKTLLTVSTLAISLSLWLGYSTSLNVSYYGTHTRMYQILAGVALTCLFRLGLKSTKGQPVFWTAVTALILLSFTSFGVYTTGVIATVISLAIIWASESFTFENKSLVLLGNLSYGVYLWHWPVTLLAQNEYRLGTLETFLVTLVVSHMLAFITYFLLEQPIRKYNYSKRLFVVPALSVSMVASVVALPVMLVSPVPSIAVETPLPPIVTYPPVSTTVPPQDSVSNSPTVPVNPPEEIEPTEPTFPPYPQNSYNGEDLVYGIWVPEVGDAMNLCVANPIPANCIHVEGTGLKVHITGDSFANVMSSALIEIAKENNWQLSFYTFTGCPWQFGTTIHTEGECFEGKAKSQALIQTIKPDVIITQSFPYATSEPIKHLDGTPMTLEEYQADTVRTIRAMVDSGAKVLTVESGPTSIEDSALCLKVADNWGDCDFVNDTYSDPMTPFYREFAEQAEGVEFASINPIFCLEDICQGSYGQYATMLDFTHWNHKLLTTIRYDIIEVFEQTGIDFQVTYPTG